MSGHVVVARAMHEGFTSGAGVDPDTLRVMVLTISTGLVFVIAAWIGLQILDAYKDERITVADAVWGTVKTAVVVSLLLFAMFS